MNILVPLPIVMEQYCSDPGNEGLGWIGFERLTHG